MSRYIDLISLRNRVCICTIISLYLLINSALLRIHRRGGGTQTIASFNGYVALSFNYPFPFICISHGTFLIFVIYLRMITENVSVAVIMYLNIEFDTRTT